MVTSLHLIIYVINTVPGEEKDHTDEGKKEKQHTVHANQEKKDKREACADISAHFLTLTTKCVANW